MDDQGRHPFPPQHDRSRFSMPYASGYSDLRKTRMCKNRPPCSRGDDCWFAHSNEELRPYPYPPRPPRMGHTGDDDGRVDTGIRPRPHRRPSHTLHSSGNRQQQQQHGPSLSESPSVPMPTILPPPRTLKPTPHPAVYYPPSTTHTNNSSTNTRTKRTQYNSSRPKSTRDKGASRAAVAESRGCEVSGAGSRPSDSKAVWSGSQSLADAADGEDPSPLSTEDFPPLPTQTTKTTKHNRTTTDRQREQTANETQEDQQDTPPGNEEGEHHLASGAIAAAAAVKVVAVCDHTQQTTACDEVDGEGARIGIATVGVTGWEGGGRAVGALSSTSEIAVQCEGLPEEEPSGGGGHDAIAAVYSATDHSNTHPAAVIDQQWQPEGGHQQPIMEMHAVPMVLSVLPGAHQGESVFPFSPDAAAPTSAYPLPPSADYMDVSMPVIDVGHAPSHHQPPPPPPPPPPAPLHHQTYSCNCYAYQPQPHGPDVPMPKIKSFVPSQPLELTDVGATHHTTAIDHYPQHYPHHHQQQPQVSLANITPPPPFPPPMLTTADTNMNTYPMTTVDIIAPGPSTMSTGQQQQQQHSVPPQPGFAAFETGSMAAAAMVVAQMQVDVMARQGWLGGGAGGGMGQFHSSSNGFVPPVVDSSSHNATMARECVSSHFPMPLHLLGLQRVITEEDLISSTPTHYED
ncbi:unnamed protein product [Vitrella brassicaformis CCMP3155]|uniref:C3H1-type domain-containing protein n=2 Tax=Vitrella brassicaformis TaxID=1169539 RepID=A0A0G4GF56_VITBC|nr:unnamed protein product [Vitrella brassicaformis CCMP3155]|eukprot:CEM28151.1 unnamed protein product [Vitrella brassicaformis CCMP3155]